MPITDGRLMEISGLFQRTLQPLETAIRCGVSPVRHLSVGRRVSWSLVWFTIRITTSGSVSRTAVRLLVLLEMYHVEASLAFIVFSAIRPFRRSIYARLRISTESRRNFMTASFVSILGLMRFLTMVISALSIR